MVDIFEIDKQWKTFITNNLGLDINDPIHTAAAYALTSSRHLFERGKKTTAKLYGKKLDKLTEQAQQLSETINLLDRRYRDCLMFSLHSQHDIAINNSDQIDQFIQALAQAAQAVKKIKIDPIQDGYYNQFLYYFVDGLLSSPVGMFSIGEIAFKQIDQTKEAIREFLLDKWNYHYQKKVREVAIEIIQKQLNDAKDKRNAQKAVDKHLDILVCERINYYAELKLRLYKEFIAY